MTAPYSVLVTGANRGIGLGLVQQLVKNDKIVKIFAGTRNPEKATDLTAISDPRLKVVQLDVQSDRSLKKAFDEIDADVGEHGLTLLISNAGVYSNYPVEGEPNRNEILRVLDTNVAGSLIVAQVCFNQILKELQTFLPLLKRASEFNKNTEFGVNRAAIVQISSGAASIGNNTTGSGDFNMIVYRASKAALNQVGKTLALDWAKYDILVASLCPGWVQTDMGGPRAMLTVEQSTSAILQSIAKYTKAETGGYFNRNGEVIPF